VTINLISLFAFILVLGIVVDDAIVTGENIFTRLQKGEDPLQASIKGTQEIAVPVTFGVLTTVVAFMPLLMIEGVRGQIFAQIPLIVIPVLLFSLVESKLILPAHLKHVRVRNGASDGRAQPLAGVHPARPGARHARGLTRRCCAPRCATGTWPARSFVGGRHHLFSIAIGGHLRFVFFPRIQAETASATLTMPPGTPFEITAEAIRRINAEAQALRERYRDPETGESVIKGILVLDRLRRRRRRAAHRRRPGGVRDRAAGGTHSWTSPAPTWCASGASQIGPIPGAKEAELPRRDRRWRLAARHTDHRAGFRRCATWRRRCGSAWRPTRACSTSRTASRTARRRSSCASGRRRSCSASPWTTSRARSATPFFGVEAQRIQRGREDVRVIRALPAGAASLARGSRVHVHPHAGRRGGAVQRGGHRRPWGAASRQIRRIDRNGAWSTSPRT
jgi:hypothetical protein